MRFYKQSHQFYCGIDLHTSKMYLCILDQAGKTVLHRNVKAQPAALLRAIEPVNFVDKQKRAAPGFAPLLGASKHLAKISNAGEHRRQGFEF